MNNFVFSQDPILYNSTIPQYQQDPQEIKKQLDVMMTQYQNMQNKSNNQTENDYLGELDIMISELDENDISILNNDPEFVQLNNNIQQTIQQEIINSIKWKINGNNESVNNIKRLKDIIKNIKREKEIEQKKNMSELNDYIQNYSDMTFNEYKKIKNMRS